MTCALHATLSDRACAINHKRGLLEREGLCTPCVRCETGRQNARKFPDIKLTLDPFNRLPMVVDNPLPRCRGGETVAVRPPRRKPLPNEPANLKELRERIRGDYR